MSTSHTAHLAVHDLCYAHPDGSPRFHALNLSVGAERVGLVGANGSGKTTLLRLVTGELTPQSGSIHRDPRWAYLPQRSTSAPDATVAHVLGVADALAALTRCDAGLATPADLECIGDDWDLPQRVHAALSTLGLGHLPLTRLITSVSGGEATRLALAARLLTAPRLLLLDEPTNDLDAASRAAVVALLRTWPHGLVVATHDRALLGVVDRIIELRDGAARSITGGWDAYRAVVDAESAAAARTLAHVEAESKRAAREAQRVADRAAHRDARGRRARHSGSQPAIVHNARQARAESSSASVGAHAQRRQEALQAARRDAKARVEALVPVHIDVPPSGLPAGRRVLEATDLTLAQGERVLVRGLSLQLRGPERVAVTGPNGAGKSTVLRALLGRHPLQQGVVHCAVPAERVAFLDQRASLLGSERTVLDAALQHAPACTPSAARDALARAGFRGPAAEWPVEQLSGGERMRAALACLFAGAAAPWLLVLDEPTNHLDLRTLHILERAIASYDGALIVVSHDAAFVDAIGVTRTLTLGAQSL
jgi:ATPase subunit of ABC transporter with duplicated ATPase domains